MRFPDNPDIPDFPDFPDNPDIPDFPDFPDFPENERSRGFGLGFFAVLEKCLLAYHA